MNSTVKTLLVGLLLLVSCLCVPMSVFAENGEDVALLNATELAADGTVLEDALASASDKNYYRFTVSKAGTVKLNFEVDNEYNTLKCWRVQLMDDEHQTFFDKTVRGSSQGAMFTSSQIGLSAGTYYIRVFKSVMGDYSSKEYELSVDFTQSDCWEKECNDTFDCSDAISSEAKIHGLLSFSGDVDVYSVCLTDQLDGTLVFQPKADAEPVVGWKVELIDKAKSDPEFSAAGTGRIEILLSECAQLNKTYYLKITSANDLKYDDFEYTLEIVTDHVCDFVEFEEKAPTCTDDGNIAYRQCKECQKLYNMNGVEIQSVVVAATGHDMEHSTPIVEKAATCTELGILAIYCATDGCEVAMRSEIPALGHRMSEEWSIDVPSTCTVAGKRSHHCLNANCNYVEDETAAPLAEHDYEVTIASQATCIKGGVIIKICRDRDCQYREDEVVAATGQHFFGEWTTTRDSTCSVKGEKKQVCKGCNLMNISELDLLAHSYSSDWTVDAAPTCTLAGSRSHHCVSCGDKTDVEPIAALGHQVSDYFTNDKLATCEVAGSKSRHCQRCEFQTDVTEIPAVGHNYSEWVSISQATCLNKGTEGKTCFLCGKTEIRETTTALGHDFGDDYVIDIPAKCETDGSKSKHCDRCGATGDSQIISATGHAYGAWEVVSDATCEACEVRKRACAVCQKVIVEDVGLPLGHDYPAVFTIDVEPQCEIVGSKSKHCDRCGAMGETQIIPATGHAYGEWKVVSDATCEKPKEQSRTCATCEKSVFEKVGNALGHTLSQTFTVDITPKCEIEGSKSKHCRRCDEKFEVTAIPSAGHTFGQWAFEADPTCVDQGTEARVCSACQAKECRTTSSALGHDYSAEFTIDVQATCASAGSKSRHCRRCNSKTDVAQIPSTDHFYDGGVVKVEATTEAFGVTVFTCVLCGSATAKQVEKLPPVMLNAEEKLVWNLSDETPMRFRSAAALADFVEVRVNGEVVPRDCYTLREGSTIVELSQQYLNSLGLGVYTLEIVSTTGVAEAEFTIEESSFMLWLWISIGVFSAVVIMACLNIFLSYRGGKKPVLATRGSRQRRSVRVVVSAPNQLPSAKKPTPLSAPPRRAQLPPPQNDEMRSLVVFDNEQKPRS